MKEPPTHTVLKTVGNFLRKLRDGADGSAQVAAIAAQDGAGAAAVFSLTPEAVANMIPPQKLVDRVGGGDYLGIGVSVAKLLMEVGRLQPGDSVLDVGCGCGRMAVPLTQYLTAQAKYEGFDIDREAIKWCQKRITPRYPNFRFRTVDLYNSHYNPHSSVSAKDFKFPYPSQSFDFAFLASIFTHMLPDDVENYLSELHRVLKPGKHCYITQFLLTEQTLGFIEKGLSIFKPGEDMGGYRVLNPEIQETAVFYDFETALEMYKRHRFELVDNVYFGFWRGGEETVSELRSGSGQDHLVLRRLP